MNEPPRGPVGWRTVDAFDYAVIGDPVGHSLSPVMQTAALRAIGRADSYFAVHVPKGEVGEALDHFAELGVKGINATVPHKADALAWCRGVTPEGARIGAVNTIRIADSTGTNTDAPGLLRAAEELGLNKDSGDDRRVLVLGAGGSAAAALFAFHEAGWKVLGWGRTRSRLEALAASLEIPTDILDDPDPAGCSLVIDATSAALSGSEVPLVWSHLEASTAVMSLMYREGGPLELPFLRRAQTVACRVADGKALLAAQGILALEFWFPDLAAEEVEAAYHAMKRAIGLEAVG